GVGLRRSQYGVDLLKLRTVRAGVGSEAEVPRQWQAGGRAAYRVHDLDGAQLGLRGYDIRLGDQDRAHLPAAQRSDHVLHRRGLPPDAGGGDAVALQYRLRSQRLNAVRDDAAGVRAVE